MYKACEAMSHSIPPRFSSAFLKAMHTLHQLAGRVMKSGNIPLAQYRLLMLMQNRPALTITGLSALLGIAQSSASELASRALESGLLRRTADPADGRRSLYSLTPKSHKLLHSRKREMDKIYAAVLAPLEPEEQQRLIAAFETIADLLSSGEAIPPQADAAAPDHASGAR